MSAAPLDYQPTSLDQALWDAERLRWANLRCRSTMVSQGKMAVDTLRSMGVIRVCDVTPAHIQDLRTHWATYGISPETINKRMSALSAMGVKMGAGARAKVPKKLKWWLKPDDQEAMLKVSASYLRDFIKWTVLTGLRVEETLRLVRSDFLDDCRSVTVPGLKTSDAQATLALSDMASHVARSRFGATRECLDPSFPFFHIPYANLAREWDRVKREVGITHPGATLKALRRTAARNLSLRGMPLDMIRQYLRHEDIQTTMGYLRLTGGYSTEEQRQWLK